MPTDDWGGVAVSSQPKPDDWGGVPVAQPKVPDLSGAQKMVQDNLSAHDNKEQSEGAEPKPPQSQMERFETGTGLPVQKIMSGSAQPSDINSANRTQYSNAVKEGSVSNGEGWLQSYFFGVGNAVQQGGEKFLGQMAYPFLSEEHQQKLKESGIIPPEGGAPLSANAALSARILHGLSEGISPISTPVNAYWTLPASIVSPLLNPAVEKAGQALPSAYSSIPADLLNIVTTGLGAAGVHYSEAIRGAAAEKLDMEPSVVTPQHVDQVIAEGSKELLPDGKDFGTVANAIAQNVYHGTPHEFENFSLQHVGTGEGAAAYGFGHYFTNNEDIANYYRTKLSDSYVTPINKLAEYYTPGRIVPSYGGGQDKVISFNPSDNGRWNVTVRAVDKEGNFIAGERERTHSTQPSIKNLDEAGIKVGNLYTARIPTDENMLYWDRPLSEQPEAVQKALERVEFNKKSATGAAIYADLVNKVLEKNPIRADFMAKKDISEMLDSLGIKGVKYPANMQTGARGEAGHNYVIFKDESVKKSSPEELENTLHEIYKKTGVHPKQMYADAQRDPKIKSAILDGKVPDAYSHLEDTRPAIPEDVKSAMEAMGKLKEGNPLEQPLPTSKEYAQDLYNRLHQKLGQDTATDIQSMQRELQTKNTLGDELDKKFYLKKEDENIKLSDEEQKLYDQHVKPLAEEERALYEKARALGAETAEPVSESYVHRIVKGKGHYLDKYDTEFGEDENIGFGKPTRSLSQSTSALEEAQFHALEDSQGNRQFKIGEIPQGYKAGDKWTDEGGKEWTIKRAKTEEIEKNTELQYYKSAIGNTEDNIRRLEKTIRNIEFLNDLKGDMEKTKLGVPPSAADHPPGYQQVSVPQLRGWSFDPRVAEVLNDIYDRGGDSLLGRINNVLIKGMFLNPIPHVENVFYDYLASRGWKNAKAIKGADYINQGIKDVKEFSPEYLDVLKRGGALKLPAVWKADFFNQMEKQFISEMQDSKEGVDLAKSWGFDSLPHLADSVFNSTQKALWGSGDAFLMAKIRELKDSGMSTDKAIEEAQKHIVDYRIPPRVGETILGPELSRMLSKSLQGNGIVVFTRYHFGLFKSLGNMVSELASGIKGMDAAKTSQAAGQLFATYFLLSVVNPAIANMWGSITGQKEKMRNPGVTGLMGAIGNYISGKKSLGQALKSQFIVSPAVQVGADMLNDKIVDSELGHKGVQLMDYLMKQPTMSIPSIPYNIREGKQSAGEEALRQIGVTPDKEYKKKKPSHYAIQKLEKEERGLMGNETP